jgi:cytochrome c biogenesis protein CcmG, thiol:disulfide interchange protein DsbE
MEEEARPEEEPEEEVVDKPLHRRLLVIVPALVLVGLIAFGALTRVEPRTGAGRTAPEFELPLLDGSGTLSSDDLKGSPVVFNFFASWCFPCREEAPALQRIADEYADEGVQVVGVNVQGGLPPTLLDSEIGAREFVQEFGITYPVVADKQGTLAKDLMDFYGLPQTFFVDHEWRFAGSSSGEKVDERQGAVVLGAISEEELQRTIEALVAESREE